MFVVPPGLDFTASCHNFLVKKGILVVKLLSSCEKPSKSKTRTQLGLTTSVTLNQKSMNGMCQSTDGLHNKDGSDRIMTKFDISLTERVESGRKMCFERMSA